MTLGVVQGFLGYQVDGATKARRIKAVEARRFFRAGNLSVRQGLDIIGNLRKCDAGMWLAVRANRGVEALASALVELRNAGIEPTSLPGFKVRKERACVNAKARDISAFLARQKALEAQIASDSKAGLALVTARQAKRKADRAGKVGRVLSASEIAALAASMGVSVSKS
jgi:hypothetical protein